MKYISSKNYLLTKGFGISTSVNTDKSLKQTVNVSPCKIPPSSVARLSTCDILQCMMCARRSLKIFCKNQGCFECKYVCLDFFVLSFIYYSLALQWFWYFLKTLISTNQQRVEVNKIPEEGNIWMMINMIKAFYGVYVKFNINYCQLLKN